MRVGPFEVLSEIARGGMGAVYRARGADGRWVALKVLLRPGDERARTRFRREAQALARLQHPGVVPILGAGEHEGHPWVALELIEGESLAARLRHGPLPIEEALDLGEQLADALAHVHDREVLHRDLNPANVLLRGGRALLADFGLVLDEALDTSRLTATGAFLGTPGYWSPEQAFGRKQELGPWSDVYGLGALLYACLTGSPPIQADSLQEHLARLEAGAISPPRALRPEVPRWLSALCMRCLDPDPAARPASAAAVRDRLRRRAREADAPSARRSPPPWALGFLLSLAAFGLGVWALPSRAPAPTPRPAAPAPAPAPSPAPSPAPVPTPSPLARALEAGQRLMEEERYADAAAAFTRAVEADPESAQAYLGRGVARARLRQHAPALADLDRALELDPEASEAWLERGVVRSSTGDQRGALRDLDRALAAGVTSSRLHAARGFAWAQLGDAERALEDLDRAVELDPRATGALLNRGALKASLRDFAAAYADFDALTKIAPDDGGAYLNRGSMALQLGQLQDALADFDRAEALDPSLEQTLATLREHVRLAQAQR